MNRVPFYDIEITDGFWAKSQKTVLEKTLWAVYDRFAETGRIKTMDCKVHDIKPHHFWGSDVFKWMEGAAYILEKNKDEKILRAVNEIVDMIEEGMAPDGYYNSYFNNPEIDEERFSNRDRHELYSLGHMIEAGVALFHATGEDKLLKLCIRNTDYVDRVFRIEQSAGFVTPGHEEIELALVRLWEATGERRYLELSEFFVRQRGANDKDCAVHMKNQDYTQSHLPVTEQTYAAGHAVRAVYLYCAIADLAAALEDEKLSNAAEALFTDIYNKKMYITGAVGTLAKGEAFSSPYHLPNQTAYSETCAALGYALFARRLYESKPDGRYGDAAERALFNGMIAGLSMEGDAFFYENPLEIDLERSDIPHSHNATTERKRVFNCSCCPPNLVRLIPSVGDFVYTYDEKYLYVHQYFANKGKAAGADVVLETKYPENGKVHIRFDGDKKLALRRPAWCENVITDAKYHEKDGYLYFDSNEVDIEFEVKAVLYVASDKVHENTGRVALMRGPIVYCLEEKDQEGKLTNIRIDTKGEITVTDEYFGGYPIITAKGYLKKEQVSLYAPMVESEDTPITLRFIPYYTFANRGADNMQVWILYK